MALPEIHFGTTGLTLPRLGLGLAALGRPAYINLGHAEDLAADYVRDAMEGRTHRMLDLAWQLGVRYFDAARSYGCAEDFLVSWIEKNGFPPEELVIGSKWGYTYTADWRVDAKVHEVKEHSVENLRKQWEESKCLRPYLKLYQIHSATLESGVLNNVAVLKALSELKGKGIMIGLSISGENQPEVLGRAMEVRIDNEPLFDSAQITYNILEQSVANIAQQAADEGLGLLIKETLANGRLTERNDSPEFAVTKARLLDLAEKYHCGIDAIALAWVLARPWAHVALSGAATERHLESNVKATRIPVTDEELDALDELAQSPEDYWGERKRMAWN